MYSKQEFPVAEWLAPESRASLKEEVKRQVSSEIKERLFRNPESHIDYGYSFPGLNTIKQACLKEIRTFYQTNGTRACVADIGAGFGTMTWKLLTAGATVDAFEIQRPTANELSRRIKNINPYFWNEDNLDDILNVFPENALNVLNHVDFKEKYDVIWISQVLHFLTPNEIQQLNSIFKHILKPGGKIFAEANCIHTFKNLDNETILQSTYNKAKREGLKFPGFLTFNAVTLIDSTINRVVYATIVSAYTQTEMLEHAIPHEINAYGMEYLGPNNDEAIISKLSSIQDKYPTHRFKINRFHQVMNLLDADTINECFDLDAFQCESYFLNPVNGEPITSDTADLANCGLAIFLRKPLELLHKPESSSNQIEPLHKDFVKLSIFNEQTPSKLLLDIEQVNINTRDRASFFESIREKNYSLALRKASAVGNLDLVKVILKYKQNLNININEPSAKNGYTALDWINENKAIEFITKERIISLLLKNGAYSGILNEQNSEKIECKT